MRYAIITMLLCACAHSASGRRLTAAEMEAGYKEFQKELLVEHYDKAKAIADKKQLDRAKVISTFTASMWQKLVIAKEITVSGTKSAFEKFKLDRAIETAFAVKVFDFYVKNDFCEMAADTALSFDLGPTYIGKAIDCASSANLPLRQPRLACRMTDIKDLKNKLVDGWVKDFKQSSRDQGRYDVMTVIAAICPLTNEQYLDLLVIGMQDKKAEFTKVILEKSSFKKTVTHYKEFIAMAVEQYECAMAAEVALKNQLSDQTLEKIFLNRKCQGGNLGSVELKLFPEKKAEWFFGLSLQAQEFRLARRIIKMFSLAEDHFDKLVTAGLAAHDYEAVLLFEPWNGERAEDYHDGILNKILDANEEWSVVRLVVEYSNPFDEIYIDEVKRNAWIERAFLHAFRRNDFKLAADAANKHTNSDFSGWATKWVFEAAMQARNADSAKFIVGRYHLGKDALRRVAMLYFQLKNEKDRKLELERKRAACKAVKDAGDWEVKKCD